jgi:ribosomal-protein-alanine N-acetyltransferase
MKTVIIRKMQPSDVDGVIQIEQEAYGDHHWSRESFLNEIGNELAKYYALYTPDGELAGYAGCWHILEEAHITNIAVAPKFRGKKFGQALLKTIIDDCYKDMIKYITLEVRVSNKVAFGLYTKYGFSSFGIRKGYYQDNNEDAHIMWTKNIFFEEFKNNYESVTKNLEGQILIK